MYFNKSLTIQQQSWPQVMPDVSLSHSAQNEPLHFYSILPPQRNSKGDSVKICWKTCLCVHPNAKRDRCVCAGRKKLRLYEYLHEALNDPSMCDSIQWTDSGNGTFHFISKNKEKLAECWGQRKGNRKTMTYQKMARALRNYSRTGEIVKVRRKLTYQFNPDILHRLGSAQVPVRLPCQPTQEEVHGQLEKVSEQTYCSAAPKDWHSWYGYYQLQEDYDLGSHTLTKL